MSQVFVHLGISIDGYIAGPNRGPKNPLGDEGMSVHAWMFQQRAFLRTHGIEEGGQTGPDNRIVEAIVDRIGANIIGKRMFEEGEANWPEEAPFHKPVFVLTKEVRSPWQRKGGTTFYFVNDGLERTLEKAREAAGAKDVRICGGRDVVLQYLKRGPRRRARPRPLAGSPRRRSSSLRRHRQAQDRVRDRRSDSFPRGHPPPVCREDALNVESRTTDTTST